VFEDNCSMQDIAELLPEPPFDLESEQLVDISVELCGDRLKGIVAWLVNCITKHQYILRAHANHLGLLEGSEEFNEDDVGSAEPSLEISQKTAVQAQENAGSRPSSRPKLQKAVTLGQSEEDAGAGSRPPSTSNTASRPSTRMSVAQSLHVSMSTELLSMHVTKLQQDLKTLPTFEHLDTKGDHILAEVSSLSENLDRQMKEAEDKIHSALGSATDDLHGRLQRICDDMMHRLETLEKRPAID
jgi:hypothetical protein